MIEFYNEPDLDLSECLSAEKFKDYYFIRSLSIQDAYHDLNGSVNVLASGFSRITYGGNLNRYLGISISFFQKSNIVDLYHFLNFHSNFFFSGSSSNQIFLFDILLTHF